MKNIFVKLTFERLKNIELKTLFNEIVKDIESIVADPIHLEWAYDRLKKLTPTLINLDFVNRKLPQTNDLKILQEESNI